jgi:mycofactocin precursor
MPQCRIWGETMLLWALSLFSTYLLLPDWHPRAEILQYGTVLRCFMDWHHGCNIRIKHRNQRNMRQNRHQRRVKMETNNVVEVCTEEEPCILEEINVEELAIDGICGVY